MSIADRLGLGPTRTVAERDGLFHVTVQAPAFMHTPARTVTLTPEQYLRYERWQSGELLIQDALPDLSNEQREFLMSGLDLDDFYPDEDDI